SAANATAARRLPTPRGPWKQYACATPSASAARNSRFASSCSGNVSKLSTYDLAQIVRVERAVCDQDPLREQFRHRAVRLVDRLREGIALAFDPIRRVRPPSRSLGRIEQEKDRAVGQEPRGDGKVQLQDPLDPQASREALVRQRRVEVAVADDVRAARQRR